jgi:hypothetical protein
MGQTVGAALAAAGQLALRETRNGAARGIFCGMGVCQECLVTVDGMPNRRACIEPARDGIHVRRQAFPGEPPGASRGAPPIGFDDLDVIETVMTVEEKIVVSIDDEAACNTPRDLAGLAHPDLHAVGR